MNHKLKELGIGREGEEVCAGGDLNPHGLRHTPLKRMCLPVPPPAQNIKQQSIYHNPLFKASNKLKEKKTYW